LLDEIGQSPLVVGAYDLSRCVITSVERPADAVAGQISWLRGGNVLDVWTGTVLIVERGRAEVVGQRPLPWIVIAVDDPRFAMLRILQLWFADKVGPVVVHPSARVHPSAVIGASDAGYVWTGSRYELFPHVGGVEIGADVAIDPLVVVSRAAIGRTIIGSGTKIGPQVTVGHGAHIGRDCLLVAQVCLGGSTVLGDRVTCWQRCVTASNVKIGSDAVIGAGSVVLCDVPPGETWVGVPARRIRGALRGI